jgi:hypothetical protein
LAAGTSNGITGAKTPPAAPGAVPKQTYIGGSMTLKVGGRRAELTHVTNAHTDGDTWIYCMAGCCARAASVPGNRCSANKRDELTPPHVSVRLDVDSCSKARPLPDIRCNELCEVFR